MNKNLIYLIFFITILTGFFITKMVYAVPALGNDVMVTGEVLSVKTNINVSKLRLKIIDRDEFNQEETKEIEVISRHTFLGIKKGDEIEAIIFQSGDEHGSQWNVKDTKVVKKGEVTVLPNLPQKSPMFFILYFYSAISFVLFVLFWKIKRLSIQNNKSKIIVAVLVFVIFISGFAFVKYPEFFKRGNNEIYLFDQTEKEIATKMPVYEPSEYESWKTYKNEEYEFEIKYPSDWQIYVSENSHEDIINIYKTGNSPLTHNSNVTQVSIFPEGLSTHGPAGESREVVEDLTLAKEKTVNQYILSNSKKHFGYFIDFENTSQNWKGFVWAGVEIKDRMIVCRDKTKDIDIDCEPLSDGINIIGNIDELEWNTVKEILSTFKFNNSFEPKVNLKVERISLADKIIDPSGLYQFTKLNGWRIRSSVFASREAPLGGQVSQLILETDNFSSQIVNNDGFSRKKYNSGATLNITVTRGEREIDHGNAQIFEISKVNLKEGVDGEYHRFSESTFLGQLRDVHINHQGNYYVIRFAYDAESYSEGEKIFNQLLDSFEFIDG